MATLDFSISDEELWDYDLAGRLTFEQFSTNVVERVTENGLNPSVIQDAVLENLQTAFGQYVILPLLTPEYLAEMTDEELYINTTIFATVTVLTLGAGIFWVPTLGTVPALWASGGLGVIDYLAVQWGSYGAATLGEYRTGKDRTTCPSYLFYFEGEKGKSGCPTLGGAFSAAVLGAGGEGLGRGIGKLGQRLLPRIAPKLATALGYVDNLASDSIQAAAQNPARSFADNLFGPRSAEEALELARQAGLDIGDDVIVKFVPDELVDNALGGSGKGLGYYGNRISGNFSSRVGWDDLLDEATGKLIISLRESVLNSDEKILASLVHELFEINALRELLADGITISFTEWRNAVSVGIRGNLHDAAWDVANNLLIDLGFWR